MASERAERRVKRQGVGSAALRELSDVAGHQQANRRRFDVAFDAGDLTGEENARVALRLKRRCEMLRSIDERVAMHRPEAREAAVLEAGDHLQDALLLGN